MRREGNSLVVIFCLLLILALSSGVELWAQPRPADTVSPAAPRQRREPLFQNPVKQSYGQVPLSFEANQGQTDPRVKFLSRGSGYSLFLTPTQAVLSLRPPGGRPPAGSQGALSKQDATGTESLRIQLVDANPNPQVVGLEELPGKVNYFTGSDPSKWRTNIPTYARVQYRGVYPGVDLAYYGNQRQLEYDFVVAPGADPRRIVLAFEGAEKLSIGPQGDLVVHTPAGELQQLRPLIYQETDGARHPVFGSYLLRGRDRAGFQIGPYDATRPLVIDPTLVYSTYLGGGNDEWLPAIAVDASGNAYVTGNTNSTDFPITPGAYDTSWNGLTDGFVAKLNTSGTVLVYSTYFGGSGDDWPVGIAVDTNGNAYMTGWTGSTNFPTVNPFQAAKSGGTWDAFLIKLNAAGNAVTYSTYLGGSSDERGNSVAVDSSNNAYIMGFTNSTNFPTANPLQAINAGGYDGFVAKLNATGSALVYSTYLGGSGNELRVGAAEMGGIAVDSSGNAYVSGGTSSPNFPTTVGALQTVYGGAPQMPS